jgi:predicted Zn-dependent protease
LYFLALPCVAGGGYVAMHLERVPHSGRIHATFLDQEFELELGESGCEEILRREQDYFVTDMSTPALQVVVRIAKDIVNAADRPDLPWEVYLVDSDVQNAFVLPGGKIFVYTGILKLCHDEAGLAFVLGHEVSHALARHAVEKIGIAAGFAVLECAVWEMVREISHDSTLTTGVLSNLAVRFQRRRHRTLTTSHSCPLFVALIASASVN